MIFALLSIDYAAVEGLCSSIVNEHTFKSCSKTAGSRNKILYVNREIRFLEIFLSENRFTLKLRLFLLISLKIKR